MNFKTKTKLLLSLILMLALSSCAELTGVRVLKLSHNHNQLHPVHLGLLHMNEKLQEISAGQMKLEIYSGEQLGSEEQCIEMLQLGSLAMTKVSTATLSNVVDEFKVFSLPYMFESKQQLFDILDGEIGEEVLLSAEKYLFRGLGFFDAGARSFYTTKQPIKTPEDIRGLRIRVMPNGMAVNMMAAFNGQATPIAYGELYTALQSGVVDGAENNPPSYQLDQHYQVSKYYTMSEHLMLPDVLIMSSVIWADLSDQEKEWLMEAVEDAVDYQREIWSETEEKSMAIVKEAGVEIYYPNKKPFIDMVKNQPDAYKDNKDLYKVVERIREYKLQTSNEE